MRPANASISSGNDNSFAVNTSSPDLRRTNLIYASFNRRRCIRLRRRLDYIGPVTAQADCEF